MTTNSTTKQTESIGEQIVREWVASLDYGSLPPGKISDLVSRIDAVSRAAVATLGDNDLVSRADAKAAICYMCADRDRYKPAELIDGSERLFHFQGSDNWNAGQCFAQAIDVIPKYVATPPVDAECVCGHLKSKHQAFADHDECLDCVAVDNVPNDGLCCEFRAATSSLSSAVVGAMWEALKAECCKNPTEAKTVVFLGENKFKKAMAQFASTSPLPSAVAPTGDKGARKLTLPELNHLSALLEAERESGSYAGPREQYYARTERLMKWCNEQIRGE